MHIIKRMAMIGCTPPHYDTEQNQYGGTALLDTAAAAAAEEEEEEEEKEERAAAATAVIQTADSNPYFGTAMA